MQPNSQAGGGIRAFVISGLMLKGLVAVSTRGEKPDTQISLQLQLLLRLSPVLALK